MINKTIKEFITDEMVKDYHTDSEKYLWVDYNVLQPLNIKCCEKHVNLVEDIIDNWNA